MSIDTIVFMSTTTRGQYLVFCSICLISCTVWLLKSVLASGSATGFHPPATKGNVAIHGQLGQTLKEVSFILTTLPPMMYCHQNIQFRSSSCCNSQKSYQTLSQNYYQKRCNLPVQHGQPRYILTCNSDNCKCRYTNQIILFLVGINVYSPEASMLSNKNGSVIESGVLAPTPECEYSMENHKIVVSGWVTCTGTVPFNLPLPFLLPSIRILS